MPPARTPLGGEKKKKWEEEEGIKNVLLGLKGIDTRRP